MPLQWWAVRTSGKLVSLAEALALPCSYSSLRLDFSSHGAAWPFVQEHQTYSSTGGGAGAGVPPSTVHSHWPWKLRCLGSRQGETLEGKQFQPSTSLHPFPRIHR